MKNKKVKRALALLLACTIVIGSVYNTRQKAYASASAIIAGGGAAVVGVETAIAYLLAILGLTAASAEVIENRDKIKEWGAEQWGNFKQWFNDNKDKFGWAADAVVAEQIIDKWGEKLSKGTLDKSNPTWGTFKEWAGNQYEIIKKTEGGGVVTSPDDVVFDKNHMAAIGSYPAWKWRNLGGPFGAGSNQYEQYYEGAVDGGYLFTYAKMQSNNTVLSYYIGVLGSSSCSVSTNIRNVYVDNSKPDFVFGKQTSNGVAFKYDNVDYGYVASRLVDTQGEVYGNLDNSVLKWDMPNFAGIYPSITSTEYIFYVAFNLMREGVFDPGQDVFELVNTGGISGVYDDAGTLDNVDVVGVGEAEDEKETALPWPGDTTLDDLLAGLLSGENTWTDVLDKLGVGVIDRTETGDMVIGNEGVTTKEWEYAGFATGVPDITLPDTATPSKELSNYTFAGLEKIFPFCLPFDMIDFIKVLDAPAQAPHFKWSFPYPTTSGMKTYDIDIDLSPFDSVAELLRDMECLLFIMGLILVTRSRMIRG